MIWGTVLVLWMIVDNVLYYDPSEDNLWLAGVTVASGLVTFYMGDFNFKLRARRRRAEREHERNMAQLQREHDEMMERVRKQEREYFDRFVGGRFHRPGVGGLRD